MRWKTTLLLLIAAVGLGAYISLYELKQPEPEERRLIAKQVVNVRPETVTRVMVELPDARLTLARTGEQWRFDPSGLRADPELLQQIFNELSPLTSERTLAGMNAAALDLKTLHLDPPIGRLSLVANGQSTTLRFGDVTPVRNRRYLQLEGRPEVFVVPSSLFESANQPLDAFRDPLLLRLNPWSLASAALAAGPSSCTLTQQDNAWRITQPFADAADRAEVGGWFNQLSSVRIQRFIAESASPEERRGFGLETPAMTFTFVEQQPAGSTITLTFGGAVPADASAPAEGTPPALVYAVPSGDVEALRRDPQGLRSKTCFAFFTNDVVRVVLTQEGKTWTIEKSGDQWKDADAGSTLAAEQVEGVLNQLADLRAGGFVEDAPQDLKRYGLDPPSASVSLWTQGAEQPQRLDVGATVEASTNRYGRIQGRTAVVRLPEVVNTVLATTIEGLQPAPAAAPAASSAPPPP
jgi:hypothetical protein